MKSILKHIFFLSLSLIVFSCTEPSLTPSQDFGAYYSRITTGAAWEKFDRTGAYADIIIDLGSENGNFVFWRGSSYLPYWETETGSKDDG